MNKNIRSYCRPVLVLMLIGVIVGLIFLYNKVDEDTFISAENDVVVEENIEGDKDGATPPPPIEENDKPIIDDSIPRKAQDGIIKLGEGSHSHLEVVHRLASGRILIGDGMGTKGDFVSDTGAIFLARVNGGILDKISMLKEKEDIHYLTSTINEHGIIVVGVSDSAIYVYKLDYDMTLLKRWCVDVVTSDIKVILGRDISIISRIDTGYRVCTLDYGLTPLENTLVNTTEDIVSLYDDNGTIVLFCNLGSIYKVQGGKVICVKNIHEEVVDVRQVKMSDMVGYALISRSLHNNALHIIDRDMNILARNNTSGDAVLYLDRLYTYNRVSHILEMRNDSGEYIASTIMNIDRILDIDYVDNRFMYLDDKGGKYLSQFENGSISSSKVDDRLCYLDDDVEVYQEEYIYIKMAL